MWPSLSEIPLFHVLNAKITFGSVNKCSTEEEANTSAAATPTSTGDDEAAGWKADGLSRIFKHKTHDCHFKLLNYCFFFLFFFIHPTQHHLLSRCVPRCLRYLRVITVAGEAATCLCPITMRSSYSTPSIRVSWSLVKALARSEQSSLTQTSFSCKFPPPPSPHAEDCNFPWCLCVCRRGSGIMLMGTSLM